MYKKLKSSFILIGIVVMASFFISCSNDDSDFSYATPDKGLSATDDKKPSERLANPNLHSLYIVNNSGYNFEISIIGAQTKLDSHDNMELIRKNRPPMIISPGQKLAFYDYKTVSDVQYLIPNWEVYDNALENPSLGMFTAEKMAQLYGILSQPENTASDRFPIWKFVVAKIVNPASNQTLELLRGNNPEAVNVAALGTFNLGYNSVMKYGTFTTFGENSRGREGVEVELVTVKWKQSNPDLRATAEVKITIDNVIRR